MAQQTDDAAGCEPADATMPGKASSAEVHQRNRARIKWVFSKFKGTDVLGPNDEHIGDVNDCCSTRAARSKASIVGVGGFLGIGSKNVAIDMSAFQVVPASTGSAAGGTSNSSDPSNIKLKVSWTKDELKNAPDFQSYKAPSNSRRPARRPRAWPRATARRRSGRCANAASALRDSCFVQQAVRIARRSGPLL